MGCDCECREEMFDKTGYRLSVFNESELVGSEAASIWCITRDELPSRSMGLV